MKLLVVPSEYQISNKLVTLCEHSLIITWNEEKVAVISHLLFMCQRIFLQIKK